LLKKQIPSLQDEKERKNVRKTDKREFQKIMCWSFRTAYKAGGIDSFKSFPGLLTSLKIPQCVSKFITVNAVTAKVRLPNILAKGNSRIFLYLSGRFTDSTLGGFFPRPLQPSLQSFLPVDEKFCLNVFQHITRETTEIQT
jgi:hypothetical protein